MVDGTRSAAKWGCDGGWQHLAYLAIQAVNEQRRILVRLGECAGLLKQHSYTGTVNLIYDMGQVSRRKENTSASSSWAADSLASVIVRLCQ